MNILRALTGLILVFIYHLPRLLYQFLLVSYYSVFEQQPNLTADPNEHLRRAKKNLKDPNSKLLYAAIEIRFALERMAQREILFSEQVSKRSLKQYDPVKKIKTARRIDPRSQFPQSIYFIDNATGERYEWGQYKPMDQVQVSEIKGRLGDLLHPKEGLMLGISNDLWYIDTREFLNNSWLYLNQVYEDNTPFFSVAGLDFIEIEEEKP